MLWLHRLELKLQLVQLLLLLPTQPSLHQANQTFQLGSHQRIQNIWTIFCWCVACRSVFTFAPLAATTAIMKSAPPLLLVLLLANIHSCYRTCCCTPCTR